MIIILNALKVLLPLLYSFSLLFYIAYFRIGKKKNWVPGRRFLKAGIVIHLVYLLLKGLVFNHFPITNPAESLSVIALDVGIIYIFLEKIYKEGKSGVFFLSLIAGGQLIASMFMPVNSVHNELLQNPVFGFHTFITIMGLSGLAVSALYGLMYLMLSQNIKHSTFGNIYRNLPALDQLETMGRRASLMGLAFLGIGILMGHYWAGQMIGNYFPFDIKIIITDLAWLIYILMWIIVKAGDIRGLQPSRWAFWGFLLLILSLMAAVFFGQTFHDFR